MVKGMVNMANGSIQSSKLRSGESSVPEGHSDNESEKKLVEEEKILEKWSSPICENR